MRMRLREFLLCGVILSALLLPTGCGEDAGPGARAGNRKLRPAVDNAVSIVLEAEDGSVKPAMVIEEFPPQRHPELGIQRASGDRCAAVPKDANAAVKEEPAGEVALRFHVPKDGVYYIYPRTWWTDGCSNSFGMVLDDRTPLAVTDSAYGVWHWIKLKPDDVRSAGPRPFELKRGEHVITFTNREDDTKLDQVYITDNPDDRPDGVMKKVE